jgi:predicted MFS family arabinose efflux permease
MLTILFAFCFFHIFTILPVFLKSQWKLSEQFIGFLMALNGLIIVLIEMNIVYSLEGKRQNTTYIRSGVLLVGLGFSLLNIFPAQPWVAVMAITVTTFGEIMSMPFMNSFWISRHRKITAGNMQLFIQLHGAFHK